MASGTSKDATSAADPDLLLLEGTQKSYSLPWNTAAVDGAAAVATTLPTSGTDTDILGAVNATADWTLPWAYGISPDNRGQALWFE